MSRPTNFDEVTFYLCELGMEKTMKLLHLTEEQIDSYIYPKPVPREKPVTEIIIKEEKYVEWEECENKALVSYLQRNYAKLRRIFVKDIYKVDSNAYNAEDRLHIGLLRILNNRDFKETDTQNIERYVNRSLKLNGMDFYRTSKAIAEKQKQYEEVISIEVPVEVELNEYQLTPQESNVLSLLVQGYAMKEIAPKISTSYETVRKIRDRLKYKVKVV